MNSVPPCYRERETSTPATLQQPKGGQGGVGAKNGVILHSSHRYWAEERKVWGTVDLSRDLWSYYYYFYYYYYYYYYYYRVCYFWYY